MARTLEVISDGGRVEYEFLSTGEITANNDLNPTDTLEEKRVRGHVNGWHDSFDFEGAPMNFIVHEGFEDMELRLDGKRVWPAQLKMHVAVVDPVDGSASYGLSSSGKMIRRGKAEAHDRRVGDGVFEGHSIGGKDKFAFAGTLTGFWCNSDVKLTIDGDTRTVNGTPPQGTW